MRNKGTDFRTEKEAMKMQKTNPLTLSGLALVLLGAAMPSMATDGGTRGTAPAIFPASAARGQIVYGKACAACHGENGDGNGPGAGPLNPKPRDFTSGTYKYRSTGTGERPTDADLLRVITDGISHTQMPSWKYALSEQERMDVVAYIKGFSEDFKDTTALDTLEMPETPPTSPEFVAEGRKVFMTLQCWTCHGTQGMGDGKSAGALKDNWGYPIRPVNFTLPRYKRGNDPQSIYKTVNTGLNGTPMTSFAGSFLFGGDRQIDSSTNASFSAKEIEDLTSYLKSQPTEADINAMSPEKKQELEQHRRWALVHYVRSLIRQPDALHWMFMEDMELTR